MKFAKKFMVVPFVKQLENPDEKYLTDIDSDMSKILNQENLSVDQKLKLYNKALIQVLKKIKSKSRIIVSYTEYTF